MSTREIADLPDLTRQRVDQRTRGKAFPTPAAVLAIGRVWERATIEKWARETGWIS